MLITGALDFVVEPLRPLFDDIVCASLRADDGRYTGELNDVPPTGEARAQAMADYADAEGLSLAESVAYADSASDLPMLEAVGLPRGREPRDPPGRHRPQAGLAGRALGQGARRAPRRPLPIGARPGAATAVAVVDR